MSRPAFRPIDRTRPIADSAPCRTPAGGQDDLASCTALSVQKEGALRRGRWARSGITWLLGMTLDQRPGDSAYSRPGHCVARRSPSDNRLAAFLAVIDPRGIPDREREPACSGARVENACIAHAWNARQQVSYWREEPLEVDAVLEGSWGKWAIEVKTGTVGSSDLRGLAEFVLRHREYRPLVLCEERETVAVERSGIGATPWQHFLLNGLRQFNG